MSEKIISKLRRVYTVLVNANREIMGFSLKNVNNPFVDFLLPPKFSLYSKLVIQGHTNLSVVTHWKVEVLM